MISYQVGYIGLVDTDVKSSPQPSSLLLRQTTFRIACVQILPIVLNYPKS